MQAPENIPQIVVQLNGKPRELRVGSTVADLLATLDISDAGTAVAVNDSVVVRSSHTRHELQAGDHIEILHAVAGG